MGYNRRTRGSSSTNAAKIVRAAVIASTLNVASSFQVVSPNTALPTSMPLKMAAAADGIEDDITRQLARARDVLAKSKAKIEEQEIDDLEEDSSSKNGVPFFASLDANADTKKEKVIKSRNEEGLFTTDGELMAEMSESEEWEVRPLLEVFESESKDPAKDPLADRDVAASIFNLRKVLQTEDYQKIFDKRNRFIGDQ